LCRRVPASTSEQNNDSKRSKRPTLSLVKKVDPEGNETFA
jgi:hypothetical protein